MSLPSFDDKTPLKPIIKAGQQTPPKTALHERPPTERIYPCERFVYDKKSKQYIPCDKTFTHKNDRRQHHKSHVAKSKMWSNDLVRVLIPTGKEPEWDGDNGIYVFPKSYSIPDNYEVLKVMGYKMAKWFSPVMQATSLIEHMDVILQRVKEVKE